jgi:hypothetical protein
MAKAQGISRMAVQRIWDRYGLKPHLTKTFKISSDKHFVEKLYDVTLSQSTRQSAGLVCRREESNSGPRPHSAGSSTEEGSMFLGLFFSHLSLFGCRIPHF